MLTAVRTSSRRYAYMKPAKYQRWVGAGGSTQPDQVRARENLVAWLIAKDDHVRAELRCTARQLGIDLHGPAFRVSTGGENHGTTVASPAWMGATQENVSGCGVCPPVPHRTSRL